ncbi:MAG: hypothetical protein ABMA01_19590, partial [Chthoniobacteraceae bacterium]
MARTLTILVYEDDDVHVNQLITAFSKQLKNGTTVRLVWFRDGFDRRNDDDDPNCYPARVKPEYVPTVIELSAKGTQPQSRGAQSWWQSEFDGAVLDIYDGDLTPVGREFGDWLATAEFAGPVFVVSRLGHDTGWFTSLRNVRNGRKGDGRWAQNAVDFLLQNCKPGQTLVNYRGREPKTLLKEFDSAATRRAARGPGSPKLPPWDCCYFGEDSGAARALGSFFRMEFFDGEAVHD